MRSLFRLICRPEMRKVYPSFPMSHVVDMPDVLREIDDFRAAIGEHFIAFDPGDVDEKLLLERALAATREGKDFVAVTLFANIPELLVAHPSVPFDSMKGFLDYAKANPGKLTYSSAGIGTLPHVTTELLLRTAGLRVTHVPYKGAAPAFTDLLAGVVQLKYDTYATSAPIRFSAVWSAIIAKPASSATAA